MSLKYYELANNYGIFILSYSDNYVLLLKILTNYAG